jgi:hypothetical protein
MPLMGCDPRMHGVRWRVVAAALVSWAAVACEESPSTPLDDVRPGPALPPTNAKVSAHQASQPLAPSSGRWCGTLAEAGTISLEGAADACPNGVDADRRPASPAGGLVVFPAGATGSFNAVATRSASEAMGDKRCCYDWRTK